MQNILKGFHPMLRSANKWFFGFYFYGSQTPVAGGGA